MTGPDHFREAEKRLEASDWQRQENRGDSWLLSAMHEAAVAQVHATLALAAATALNPGIRPSDWGEWVKAAGGGMHREPR